MSIVAKTLEHARSLFLSRHNHKVANTSRQGLEFWIKHADIDPVEYAVRGAMAANGLDSPEIKKEIYASLKFRVLAGILSTPVRYDQEPQGGVCAHQTYDERTGSWTCKVPNNQDQVDKWHEVFGMSPTCPFHEPPMPQVSRFEEKNQLDQLLSEGVPIDDAFRLLGLTK